METLQIGYLHAVAAAASCTLSNPRPDRGVDWIVSHESKHHIVDSEVDLKIQLKSTYQIPPRRRGDFFGFPLDNPHLSKLAQSPVSVPRILVVMIVPRDIGEWIKAESHRLSLRHCCYWANLEGVSLSGRTKTSVRIPTRNIFDDVALCGIMRSIGRGETPR
jgi:hypothetical protein